jgi:hypothetical protein
LFWLHPITSKTQVNSSFLLSDWGKEKNTQGGGRRKGEKAKKKNMSGYPKLCTVKIIFP